MNLVAEKVAVSLVGFLNTEVLQGMNSSKTNMQYSNAGSAFVKCVISIKVLFNLFWWQI